VESVTAGSCAEKAGVQVGDIIIRFNGVDVENNAGLLSELKKVQAGDTVNMTLFRAGAEVEVSVTLDERPEQSVLDQQLEELQKQEPETKEYFYQFPEGFGFGG
jgi:serine protease Do